MALVAHPDWYLREWLDYYRMSQADLMRLTDWDRRKASHLVTGRQPYKRDDVNEAARALNLAAFELLIHPDEAFAYRRMKSDAVRWVAENPQTFAATEDLASDADPGRLAPRRKAG